MDFAGYSGVELGVEHQAERGPGAELEPHVPQPLGIVECHAPGGQRQGVQACGAAPDLLRGERETPHDGGAYDRRPRADQQGIGGYPHDSDPRAMPPPEETRGSYAEQTGDDGNVESTNGKTKSMLLFNCQTCLCNLI